MGVNEMECHRKGIICDNLYDVPNIQIGDQHGLLYETTGN